MQTLVLMVDSPLRISGSRPSPFMLHRSANIALPLVKPFWAPLLLTIAWRFVMEPNALLVLQSSPLVCISVIRLFEIGMPWFSANCMAPAKWNVERYSFVQIQRFLSLVISDNRYYLVRLKYMELECPKKFKSLSYVSLCLLQKIKPFYSGYNRYVT